MVIDMDFIYAIAERVWSAHARRWWFSIEKEDAIQYAVIRCWRNIDNWDGKRAQAATFFSMICRQEMGHRNTQAKRHADASEQSLNYVTSSGTEVGDLHAATDTTDMVEVRDEVALVRRAMETLTVRGKEAVESIAAAVPAKVLAKKWGCSQQAVSKSQLRGLEKVREILSRR